MIRVVLLGLWVASHATSVRASDVDLLWVAPARDCPDREQFRSGLALRLGREVSFGSDARIHVDARIEASSVGYSLTLRTHSDRGSQQRQLEARNCNELARASVLIVALLFPEHANRTSATDAEERASERGDRLQPRARAAWVVDLGALPLPAFGAGLAFGLGFGAASFELGGFVLLPRDGHVPASAEPVARLQLMAAVASACFELVRQPALAPCVGLELGELRGSGQGLARVANRSSLWVMPEAGVRAGLELTRTLWWSLGVAVGLPLDRTVFTVRDLGPVHEVPRVVARVATGLELRL